MTPSDLRLVRDTAVTIVALVAVRLVAAAWTPLTFDEAYYWMWSQHLAGGYYDHPPGVAFSVYDQEPIWWLAGAAGALMGVVWNYAMSGLFVWRRR